MWLRNLRQFYATILCKQPKHNICTVNLPKVLENIHVTIMVLIVKCWLHSYDIVKVASAIDIWSTTALPSNEICSNINGYCHGISYHHTSTTCL